MYLIADIINGVQKIYSLSIPNKKLKFMDQENFYENLKSLKYEEIIVTIYNYKIYKKINKKYIIKGN